jgi:ElaB/YqjD/DUF883 family membrane-anchored ribosome-binding protein
MSHGVYLRCDISLEIKMKLKNTYSLLLLIVLSLIHFGCEEGPLKVSVRYDSFGELKSKVPVYSGTTEIGHIEEIVSTDGGDYLVKILIVPEHKGFATDSTQFFIEDDPLDSNRKALILEQTSSAGIALQDGSVVAGARREGFLSQMITSLQQSKDEASGKLHEAMQGLKDSFEEGSRSINKQLEEALEDIDQSITDFSGSEGSGLNDAELEKLQQSLDDLIDEFKRSSEEIQNRIREDILPQLRKDLNTLKDRLQKDGRNDDAKEIDSHLIEI